MAWSVANNSIGTANGSTASATTITITTDVTIGSGEWIEIEVFSFGGSTVTGVADNGPGLTWTSVAQFANGSTRAAKFRAYAPAGMSSGTVITATYSAATQYRAIGGTSFAGGVEESRVESTASGSGSTAAWSASPTASNAGDLITVGCNLNNTPGSDTPDANSTEAWDFAVGGAPATYTLVYRNAPSAAATAAGGTWSGANDWIANGAAFSEEAPPPEVSYVDSALGGTAATTSDTITVPATVLEDDLMIVEFTHRGTGNGTVTDNSGDGVDWTRKGGALYSSSTFSVQQYYKRVTAAMAGGGDTVTVGSTTNSTASVLTVYRGAITTGDPFEDWDADPNKASGAETHTGTTSLTDRAMIGLVVGTSPDVANTFTAPVTERAERLSTGGTDTAISHGSYMQAAAGATGTLTFNWATNQVSAAIAYAIEPEPAAGGGTDHEQPVDDTITGTDAQTKTVGKAVADTGSLTDNNTRTTSFVRQIDDTISGTDAVSKAPAHPLADTASATDAATAAVGKGIADTGSLADAQTKAATHPIADSGTLDDDVTIEATGDRTLQIDDTVEVTDATERAWDATLAVPDTASVTDQISTGGSTAHTLELDDTIQGTDALTKQAARVTADNIAGTDQIVKAPAKGLADTATGTDLLNRAWVAKVTVPDTAALTDFMFIGEPPPAAILLAIAEPARHLKRAEQAHHLETTELAALTRREHTI